ncbi:MAG TPA: hypothetical protein VI168_18255 [Croceibacterium sp.]
MRRISEEEAWAAAGSDEPPLLAKAENDRTQSAVALKRWPDGIVLGVSCDLDDRFELYKCANEAEAWDAYLRHVERMDRTGRPFTD